ncbi:MAG: type I 3-dehydroquinate dehydratase, partial [Hyphomicrobiales bacterium]|nr:type I 3-dehydroquinate dehydratase [Hyphomicrobiales bacterium]
LGLFRLADRYRGIQKVILGMGDYGFPTRILSRRMGSMWTYTSAADSSLAAPGQASPETLREVYYHSRINASDTILCVIGNPVMHSKSPLIHNRGLKLLGLPYIYIPILVDEIDAFFELAEYLGIAGVSVMVPHKEAVLGHCADVSDEVAYTRACNTLLKREGGWTGSNTDIAGFLLSFKRFLGCHSLSGEKIVVLGAGGAAKGIVFGLKQEGAEILIANRTAAHAERLAGELGCRGIALAKEQYPTIEAFGDIFVQTTSCGMHPYEELDPLALRPHPYEFHLYYDS